MIRPFAVMLPRMLARLPCMAESTLLTRDTSPVDHVRNKVNMSFASHMPRNPPSQSERMKSLRSLYFPFFR